MNFQEELIKHSIISTIQMIREKIGMDRHDFKYLFNQSIEQLEKERDITIEWYNKSVE